MKQTQKAAMQATINDLRSSISKLKFDNQDLQRKADERGKAMVKVVADVNEKIRIAVEDAKLKLISVSPRGIAATTDAIIVDLYILWRDKYEHYNQKAIMLQSILSGTEEDLEITAEESEFVSQWRELPEWYPQDMVVIQDEINKLIKERNANKG